MSRPWTHSLHFHNKETKCNTIGKNPFYNPTIYSKKASLCLLPLQRLLSKWSPKQFTKQLKFTEEKTFETTYMYHVLLKPSPQLHSTRISLNVLTKWYKINQLNFLLQPRFVSKIMVNEASNMTHTIKGQQNKPSGKFAL